MIQHLVELDIFETENPNLEIIHTDGYIMQMIELTIINVLGTNSASVPWSWGQFVLRSHRSHWGGGHEYSQRKRLLGRHGVGELGRVLG